jgi:hypothetical protein
MPQDYDDLPFQIDHIIARKHDGSTTAGRATIAVLEINPPQRIALRQALVEEGLFPPVVAEQLSAPNRRNPKRIPGGFKR